MRIPNRAGAALLAAALVVLALVVVVFQRDADRYMKLDAASDRLRDTVDAIEDVLSAMKDAETGQRGFLITERQSYLDPYTRGLKDYRDSLATLRGLTDDDPAVAGIVREIADMGEKKIGEMAATVVLTQSHDRETALARVRQDIGKTYMDQFRGLAAALIGIEEAAFKRGERAKSDAGTTTRYTVAIAAAVLFLLTLGGTALLHIEIRQERRLAAELEVSERSYRDLAQSLEDQVGRRTLELRELNAELLAFSYSVSHDLRAPLRSIDGFSQMVLEDYSERLDDAGKDMLRRIRTGAKRMGQLIQSLLDLSRVTRQELKREPVSISSMAEGVLEGLAALAPGRGVKVTIARDLEVDADPQMLRIVMENLLGNAWKFTARTEHAEIEVGRTRREDVFFVRDNGAGFDDAHAERLFTPFQRLHSEAEFEGTGIGLATVQRVIHRHGGRIRAESKRGEGATFFFSLTDGTWEHDRARRPLEEAP